MLKQKIKRVLEHAASRVGKHQRTPKQPELLILGYHRILPEDHSEFHLMQPGMRVRPETLEMHIKVLKQYFEYVDLNDWVSRIKRNEPVPNKAVALTFDDGWIDNYEYAYPILKQEQVPATIFLVSSMIGTNKQFWPERVANIIYFIKNNGTRICNSVQIGWFNRYKFDIHNKNSFNEDGINSLILRLKNVSDEMICESLAVFSDIENKLNYPIQILNKEQLLEMKYSGLVSYGAHTINHYRLDKIVTQTLLENEILKCKSDLEKILDVNVSGFCYPNGNVTEKSITVIKKEYQYSCTTQKGWNTAETDSLLLNRILVHDDVSFDPVSFKARISGLI